jgi:hypothetical protein
VWSGTVKDMADIADLLMLSGVVRSCPDCHDDRIFVPIDNTPAGEYCCTSCGAGLLIDPALDSAPDRARVA